MAATFRRGLVAAALVETVSRRYHWVRRGARVAVGPVVATIERVDGSGITLRPEGSKAGSLPLRLAPSDGPGVLVVGRGDVVGCNWGLARLPRCPLSQLKLVATAWFATGSRAPGRPPVAHALLRCWGMPGPVSVRAGDRVGRRRLRVERITERAITLVSQPRSRSRSSLRPETP